MTWAEIKRAVEGAGVKETDEIRTIHCDNHDGNKTFHMVKLGKAVKLAEDTKEQSEDSAGCAV